MVSAGGAGLDAVGLGASGSAGAAGGAARRLVAARVFGATGRDPARSALARSASVLQTITTAGDLVELAEGSSWPLGSVARLYHATGEIFAFDRVRAAAGAYAVGDNFERTALRRLIEDLLVEQTGLTRTIMAFAGGPQAGDDPGHAHKAAAAWAALHAEKAEAARRAIEDIEAAGGGWTFAKLTIANAALRELSAADAGKKRRRGKAS